MQSIADCNACKPLDPTLNYQVKTKKKIPLCQTCPNFTELVQYFLSWLGFFHLRPSVWIHSEFFFTGGAGNSNTGNVGRALVSNADKVAELCLPKVPHEIGVEIIEGLSHFLIAIKSKYVLDPVKFGALCAQKLIEKENYHLWHFWE